MARPRQVSDAQILAAAREVFLDAGPSVAVSEIAARLGVTQAALFQRVGSKQQLLETAFAPGVPACMRELAEGPVPQRPASAQLVALLLELAAYFERVLPGLVVLRAAGLPTYGARPAYPPPPIAVRMQLARWLRRSPLDVAQPRQLAEALLGAIEARVVNRHLGGPAFAPGDDRAFVRSLVSSLVLHPGTRRRSHGARRARHKENSR